MMDLPQQTRMTFVRAGRDGQEPRYTFRVRQVVRRSITSFGTCRYADLHPVILLSRRYSS